MQRIPILTLTAITNSLSDGKKIVYMKDVETLDVIQVSFYNNQALVHGSDHLTSDEKELLIKVAKTFLIFKEQE